MNYKLPITLFVVILLAINVIAGDETRNEEICKSHNRNVWSCWRCCGISGMGILSITKDTGYGSRITSLIRDKDSNEIEKCVCAGPKKCLRKNTEDSCRECCRYFEADASTFNRRKCECFRDEAPMSI